MESNIIHSVSRIDCLHLVVLIVLVGENIAPIIHLQCMRHVCSSALLTSGIGRSVLSSNQSRPLFLSRV